MQVDENVQVEEQLAPSLVLIDGKFRSLFPLYFDSLRTLAPNWLALALVAG